MKPKYLMLIVAPIVMCLMVTIIAYFASFAMTVITGDVDVLDTSSALVDEGIFNLFRYTLIIILCGLWYAKSFPDKIYFREAPFSVILKKTFLSKSVFLLIILGISIQVSTDAILYILSHQFSDFFSSYNVMIESLEGSKSVLLIFSVCTIGPLSEELIFRGLTLNYALKAFEGRKHGCRYAVIIQAVLFAIYHGNVIQSSYALIFGLMFGAIAVKAESIIPTVFLHAVVNASLYALPTDIFKSTNQTVLILVISAIILALSFTFYLLHFSGDDKPSE